MATLGSCLLSHDIPFEGMAKDIVERRIAGQSWKQIGEDLNIGSPGAARKTFTKLTGITDYKIKGSDLLKLVKDGVPDGGPLPSAVASVPKAPATPLKELSALEKNVALKKLGAILPDDPFDLDGWPDLTPFERSVLLKTQVGTKLTVKQVQVFSPEEIVTMYKKLGFKNDIPLPLKPYDKTPDVVQPPPKKIATKQEIPDNVAKPGSFEMPKFKAQDVDDIDIQARIQIEKITVQQSNIGYTALQTKLSQQGYSLTLEQIDRVVSRNLSHSFEGDMWQMLQAKQNSLIIQKQLSKAIYEAIENGVSPTDIMKAMGVPKRLIDDVVKKKGNWSISVGQKLPADPVEVDLPDYQAHLSNAKPPKDVDPGSVQFGFGSGRGNTDELAYPKATNAGLTEMRNRKWAMVKSSTDRHYPEFYVRQYTGSAYSSINSGLRRGGKGTGKQVKNIDDAMYEVDEAFSVTRGMGVNGFGLGHMSDTQIRELIGKTFTDKGYLSTSTKPVFSNRVRLNIEVPAGARGHWAKPISQHSGEDEFILARGTKLMILGIEEKAGGFGGSTFIVRARVIV